jgi:hypothetical protein
MPFRAGGEFQVNSHTSNARSAPSAAMDDDGGFVVVWESIQDGYGNGLFARRFGSGGNPLGIEFQVNSYTSGEEAGASVAVDADGDSASPVTLSSPARSTSRAAPPAATRPQSRPTWRP